MSARKLLLLILEHSRTTLASFNRMCFLLLQTYFSCDINLQDEKGNTALHYAVMANRSDLIQVLLSKGASVVIKDGRKKTPLQHSVEMVSALIHIMRFLVFQ